MVQSQIKAVEKMDAQALEPVEMVPVWRFSIPDPEPLGRPILSVEDVSLDYKPVLEDETNVFALGRTKESCGVCISIVSEITCHYHGRVRVLRCE
jgi:hypothetical protein